MVFKKIDHVAIAVPDLKKGMDLYESLLGIKAAHIEEVVDQKVKAAFFPVDDTNIELLFPTSPDSPISKFLEKKPTGGLHHICLEVSNIEKHLEDLKAKGVTLIDDKPRIGAHGKRVAFVHPKSTGGVLIELSESTDH